MKIKLNMNLLSKLFTGPKNSEQVDKKPKGERVHNHLLQEDGQIQLYKYKSVKLSKEQLKKSRNILVVGETGCGKTTLINSFVNCFQNINIQDNYRYVLIHQNKNRNESQSDTSQATIYNIYNDKMKYPIRIIDTPGFADTRGYFKDKEIIAMIKRIMKEIKNISMILFVMKSTQSRLTAAQKYVIESIGSLFGKDIQSLIRFVYTFCDCGKAKAQKTLLDSEYKFLLDGKGKSYKVNNSAVFSGDNTDDFVKRFWEIGMISLKSIQNQIERMQPHSLKQSIKVLDYREQLQSKRQGLSKMIKRKLVEQQNIRKIASQMEMHEDQINANRNFTITRTFTVSKQISVPSGQFTTYCTYCRFTCHQNCIYSDSKDKKLCSVMSGDYCTVCPQGCFWDQHKNFGYTIVYEQQTSQITSQDILNKYNIARNEKNKTQKVYRSLSAQYDKLIKGLAQIIQQYKTCLAELQQINLMPRKQQTIIQYLQMLIEGQEAKPSPGYKQRIKSYRDTITQLENSKDFDATMKKQKQNDSEQQNQSQQEEDNENEDEDEDEDSS